MDEYEEDFSYQMPILDVVTLRADALIRLSMAVDTSQTSKAKQMLLKAMDSIAYSIDPPRGQFLEIHPATTTH